MTQTRSYPHLWLRTVASALLTSAFLVGLSSKPGASQTAQPAPLNPVIDVGIVQRFGDEPTESLTLQPLTGDRLTLRFQTGGQAQTITTANPVKIEVTMQALPQPEVSEQVVLSTHRSFESAEDSANQWRAKGIEVEIAQPRQWQVWAKRDVYDTPLLRRLLLQNLQAHGARTAFINTQILRQEPKASFVVNGYRYNRDEFDITTANSRVNVTIDNNASSRRLYAGTMRIQPNAYGNYTLVNRVPIETYLRGVVPHEIGIGAPPTTIQAQAILARTYALRNVRRFAIDNYQLCADTQCQVYRGLSGAVAETDRAITATRGLVLTYQNELVDALYSSTTGGITAPFQDVWNGDSRPYLRAVVDSVQNIWDLNQKPLSEEANFRAFISRQDGFNEDGWDQFRWRIVSTMPELVSDLKQYLTSKQSPLASLTQIQSIQVVERSPAGRVLKMTIQTDRGTLELEKDEILRALYAPNSTLFYLEPVYEPLPATPSPSPSPTPSATATPASPQAQPPRILRGYAFVGGGLGHGVGMSQTGAYHLGDLNWSAARILSFYYPGTQLQPLTDRVVYWRETPSTQPVP